MLGGSVVPRPQALASNIFSSIRQDLFAGPSSESEYDFPARFLACKKKNARCH
jgi:hypothetical protein